MKEHHYAGLRRSILGSMILVPVIPFVLILGIGYIMAGFDEQKRTLHDRICDTRVIKSGEI